MPPPTDRYYTPPDLAAHEFDDSRLPAVEREAGTRWLSGFNGRIGYPAQEVQLSWRTPRAVQALVATRRAHEGEVCRSLRFIAVVVLDSAQFYDPGPPLRPALAGWEHINRLADDGAIWHPGEMMVDQEPARAQLTGIAGCRVGYAALGDVVVFFVHRRLGDDRFALRRLTQPTHGYRIDPAEPQTAVELEREWDEFFPGRPDLDQGR